MTDKDEAKPAPKWGVIEVHPGELTEIMAIDEGTIYRVTLFSGPETAIPAAVAMVFVPSGPNPDDH